MQIVKNLKENTSHKLKGAGAYEWWHFDCIDEDNEYSFVAKFLTGNPFSNKYQANVKEHLNFPELKRPEMIDYTSLSFSLYLKGRIVYSINYDYERNYFKVESNNLEEKISLEKNFFIFKKMENTYFLNINLSSIDLDKKFKAEFTFTVKNENPCQDEILNNTTEEKHFWLPAATVCEVTGKFKFYINFKRMKTEFNGFGYFDHHWGDEALFINIQNLYWGRVVSNEYSVMYCYIDYFDKDKKPFKKLVIYKDGKVETDLDEFNFDTKSKMSFSSLNINKEIAISSKDIKLVCRNKTKLEDDYSIGRYLSDFDLELKGKNVLKNIQGISENLSLKKFKKDD
ncbi:MAG: hypothetical protein KDD00_05645 [Ignavibacteriae bacterium]|nr:hypothetical protein [Ignavibacteriota bacterium]